MPIHTPVISVETRGVQEITEVPVNTSSFWFSSVRITNNCQHLPPRLVTDSGATAGRAALGAQAKQDPAEPGYIRTACTRCRVFSWHVQPIRRNEIQFDFFSC